jgi:hypothetical protein
MGYFSVCSLHVAVHAQHNRPHFYCTAVRFCVCSERCALFSRDKINATYLNAVYLDVT